MIFQNRISVTKTRITYQDISITGINSSSKKLSELHPVTSKGLTSNIISITETRITYQDIWSSESSWITIFYISITGNNSISPAVKSSQNYAP